MDIAAQPEIKDKDPGSKQNEIVAAAHVRTGTPTSTCKRIGKSPASPPVSQGPIPELQRSHQGPTSQLKIKGREGINFGAVEMPFEGDGAGQPRNQNWPSFFLVIYKLISCLNMLSQCM